MHVSPAVCKDTVNVYCEQCTASYVIDVPAETHSFKPEATGEKSYTN